MNRTRAAAVIFCAFAIASVASPTSLRAGDDLQGKIDDALNKSEWKDAAGLLRAQVEAHKDDAGAWFELGRSLFQIEEYKEALSHFRTALQLDAGDRPAAVMLGRAAAELGDLDALGVLSKSFGHDPDVLYFSGMTALTAQRMDNDFWGKLDARYQANWGGYAVRDFRLLATIEPAYPGLDRQLGYSLLQMRDQSDLEEAVPHLRRATQEPGSGWEDSAALAECLTRLDLRKTAGTHWAEAKRRGGNAIEMDFRRARALREIGRAYEALAGFKQVFAAQGDYPSIRHEIGLAAFDAGDFAIALWAFGESRRLTGHARDDYMIGRTAYAMGDDAWAEKVLGTTLTSLEKEIKVYRDKHNKEDPHRFWMEYLGELRHYLGRAQWETGKHAEAIKNLESAWQWSRWNKVYRKWLFRFVLESDDYEKAIALADQVDPWQLPEAVDEILAKWPTDQPGKPPHRLRLMRKVAMANFSRDRFAAALKGFNQVSQESPGEPISLEHAWSAIITGDLTAAGKLLASVGQLQPPAMDEARVAQAVLLLRQGKPGPSADAVKSIADDSPYSAVRDAILLHAGIAADRKDLPKPNPFTAFGIVHLLKKPTVMAVFPGSTAEKAGVLPGDQLNVVGKFYFYPAENWQELRTVGFPGNAVNLVVMRMTPEGDSTALPLTLDYRPLLDKLGLMPDPNSSFK